MATYKATVVEVDEKRLIKIECEGEDICIPMSDDRPTEVKSAFNKLIRRVKEVEFQIVYEAAADDLFAQVAREYITQLNREIQEVRGEMQKYGLIAE